MSRTASVAYGGAVYTFFLLTFLYAIGFVENLVVPKSIDSGPVVSTAEALLVNLALLGLFAVQHSLMARPFFKRWWTRLVPKPVERSTYVLFASAILALLFWQWRPMPAPVWSATDPAVATALVALSFAGWGLVLVSTFLLSHFELFGLRQVILNFIGREPEAPVFHTPLLYKHVRHPIYLGFLIAFWSAPVMSVGHLLFAIGTTGYILIGIHLEERDLVDLFGEQYRAYKRRVGMLLPFPKVARDPAAGVAARAEPTGL
jgi:protein-S-isoprenylcysteine O-methyltransferase Ste14